MKIFEKRNRASHPRMMAGFTMVEIALCLAVIAFALVAIIGVLPVGMDVQKNNREETLINFDAKYLMDAIRSGTVGQDELTNYIISFTNNFYIYTVNGTVTNLANSGQNWFNTFTNAAGQYYSLASVAHTTTILTNGEIIIGLLSMPKYIVNGQNSFVSNYNTADFRAITGSPTDQGVSQASRDFAFKYRVYPEIVPFSTQLVAGNPAMNPTMNPLLAYNLQNNLSEIRLRFRWPVLPGGLGQGTETYRTAASGVVTNILGTPFYFIQPQGYAANQKPFFLP